MLLNWQKLDPHSAKLVRGGIEIIAQQTREDGFIPFSSGNTCDPWNMVEAAMGMMAVGEQAVAKKVYEWMRVNQQDDGTYCAQYENGTPCAKHTSVHTFSYLSVATYQQWLITRNLSDVLINWPSIVKAIQATLKLQTHFGDVAWSTSFPALNSTHSVADDALVAGCSSIAMSLHRAIQLGWLLHSHGKLAQANSEITANTLHEWQVCLRNLLYCLKYTPDRFDRTWPSKKNFAMDWYYPMLTGCVDVPTARIKLTERWDEFVVDGIGCLCSTDNDWITVAETCELIMVLVRIGGRDKALELWSWLQKHMNEHGWTQMGYVVKSKAYWPSGEYPTWSAGAVLLAADSLFQLSPAHSLFQENIPE